MKTLIVWMLGAGATAFGIIAGYFHSYPNLPVFSGVCAFLCLFIGVLISGNEAEKEWDR